MFNLVFNLVFYATIILCLVFMFFGVSNLDYVLIGISVLFAIASGLIFLNSK